MVRRTGVLLVTALLVSAAALTGGVTSASASIPPMTGTVACALDGDSTFSPWLGFSPERDPRVNPAVDSKWKVLGNLTGCTGTQSGGNPRLGQIASGAVLIKATAVDHTCQKVTDFGLTLTRLRVLWKDAQGRSLRISFGTTGTVTTSGLYNGYPYLDYASPFHHPGYVAPGIITVTATGTIDPAAKVFPGQTFTFSGTVDRTLETMAYPCSYDGPPLRHGISGFGFQGAQGPSSLSVG